MKWILWVELKSAIQFHKFMSKVNTTPALKQFYSNSDAPTKLIEFTFETNPEQFAKTFPKSACSSIEYIQEGTTEKIKIV